MAAFKNITNIFTDAKIRVLVVFLVIGVLIIVGIAFTGMRTKQAVSPDSGISSTRVSSAPEIESTPGVKPSSEQYSEILRRSNLESAQKALKTGESFVPTPLAEKALPMTASDAAKRREEEALARARAQSEAALRQQQLAAGRREHLSEEVQQRQQALQEYQKRQAQESDLMGKMADRVLAAWEPVAQQLIITPEFGRLSKAAAGPTADGSTASEVAGAAEKHPADIKAGDIIFGVMITSVNSDEPGPIMAKVVSGQYNGAKLVGRFTVPKNGDKMILEFNTFNIPEEPQSYAINAVAIDPETARTALATSVNHHYMLRYGTFFASNFLAGLAEAIALPYNNTAGSNQGTGNIIIQQPGNFNQRPLNAKDTATYALGKLGAEAAKQMNFLDRPATVKIACGTPVGILFQSDFETLASNKPKSINSPLENIAEQAEFSAVQRLHLKEGPAHQTTQQRTQQQNTVGGVAVAGGSNQGDGAGGANQTSTESVSGATHREIDTPPQNGFTAGRIITNPTGTRTIY